MSLRLPALHPDEQPGATPTTSSPTPTADRRSSDNTAPLCPHDTTAPRTHSAWDYTVLDRGTYLWTTPNGITLIRDHHGTHEP